MVEATKLKGPYSKIAGELGISTELVRQVAARIRRPPRETLRAGEAAALLGIHVNTLRRWAEQGKLRMYRLSDRGDRRFRRTEIESFLRQRRQ
jgi:excisionase family DNA binding protein